MRIARRFIFLIALSSGLLAGCSNQEAQEAVKKLLNDPESARFSEVKAGKQQGDVCGMVNAKNRMGGYVGDTPFFYEKSSGYTAMLHPLQDSDFRSLWLGIKAGNMGDDLEKVMQGCRLATKWDTVCIDPLQQPKHPMCDAMSKGGKELHEAMRLVYDR
jgi:hypothetical protein